MRVMVLGGTRFIGAAVVEELHDRRQRPKVLFATHFHELTQLAIAVVHRRHLDLVVGGARLDGRQLQPQKFLPTFIKLCKTAGYRQLEHPTHLPRKRY